MQKKGNMLQKKKTPKADTCKKGTDVEKDVVIEVTKDEQIFKKSMIKKKHMIKLRKLCFIVRIVVINVIRKLH